MDDVERSPLLVTRLVGGVQAVQRLRDDGRREREGDPLFRGQRQALQARERIALDVLHDHEELVLLGDDVERRDDVRMPDRRS